MHTKHICLLVLLLALVGTVASCTPPGLPDSVPPGVAEKQIVMAVEAVEATLGTLQDAGGYRTWTPSQAVGELVPLLNAAATPLEGEPELPDVAGKIRYVTGKPTGPWQIVLIPLDERGVIRVEGYGSSTSEPVYTKEIAVPEWG